MKFTAIALALIGTFEATNAFSVAHAFLQSASAASQRTHSSSQHTLSLNLAKDDDDEQPRAPKRSRIEGNQVAPSARDIEVMDEMITKLSNAKPYELPNAVRRAFRVISSPRFFMRIAERTDMAESDDERSKLGALASNLVATLEVVVETTEEQLDERAKEVEDVVKAAAEPESGEFLV
eukprot:CAMPEP_0176100854 /NCGR_PEP_ID=MMETSP0120_2-20121206/50585_1 /TAXON_ID=160619 /ORGANISM="Kryptoperidinium foliaceum, Strain CCMP 1326" /LENGTH=178 /DNA_ID=CAMNT_0017434903 /DNA_START=18 /DNA_END=550 /DNA_ORIENTATION=+